jgi:integrase/recombinase XerD
MTISQIWDEFLIYKEVEEERSTGTIAKYIDCKNQIIKLEGDIELEQITVKLIIGLKLKLIEKELSPARIASIVSCFRSLLRYCREQKNMQVLNPCSIKYPKRDKKDIVYLTNEEVKAFLGAINIHRINGLRFRALCEVLLESGCRISEALSLNRDSINTTRQTYYVEENGVRVVKWRIVYYANIVGKGGRRRKVYFSARSMAWVKEYLSDRQDSDPALFVTENKYCPRYTLRRLTKGDLWRYFKCATEASGIGKTITPHILRHTFCTNLLLNGCGIYHIKDLAGHSDIKTTINHYAALDDRALIEARFKFQDYEVAR